MKPRTSDTPLETADNPKKPRNLGKIATNVRTDGGTRFSDLNKCQSSQSLYPLYASWKLQKAWRADGQGHVLEEYPVQ